MDFTVEQARKVLAVVDAGLVKGLGVAKPGAMCAADAAARDRALTKIADIALSVLRDLNAPGVALWDAVSAA